MSVDADQIAGDVIAVGETITLRRPAPHDIYFDVVLPAVIGTYTIAELTEAIAQGDQKVIISNKEILGYGWPGPPRRNDIVITSEGGQMRVMGVVTNKISNEIVSHILQVRG